jgi:hypothetical protein
MFFYTLALGASNKEVQERFQHSGETVSWYLNEVLRSMCLLAVELIKPVDLEFSTTPTEIAMNPRYMSHFKVKNNFSKLLNNWKGYKEIFWLHFNWLVNYFVFFCRIVLERLMEHMCVLVYHKKIKYHLLANIMVACSFDMQFIFVWARWEGSAHDTRIFLKTIGNPNIRFPKPPEGIEKLKIRCC